MTGLHHHLGRRPVDILLKAYSLSVCFNVCLSKNNAPAQDMMADWKEAYYVLNYAVL
jgi:hypothetical protein